MGKPDFLCIGHCCHDLKEGRKVLGGTASYASIVAKKLGRNPSVFTTVGRDFQFFNTFKELGIPFYYKLSKATTQFENRYSDGKRQQTIISRADDITTDDIPKAYRKIPVILIGPIADEIDARLIEFFNYGLVGVVIQGFLRSWDGSGKVVPKMMDWATLKYADIVFLSDEDIKGMEGALSEIINYAPMVVMTHGKEGAKVFRKGNEYIFPSFPVHVKDATGAGDTFAAAFLLKYHETRDVSSACIYAHCVASFIIEEEGITGLPGEDRILARISDYKTRFSL